MKIGGAKMRANKYLCGNDRSVHARFGRHDRGATAIEFALVLPVLMLLVLGIIQFGLLYQNQLALTHAAREGARMAAIGTWNQAEVVARAFPATPTVTTVPANLALSVRGQPVTVTLTFPYRLQLLPFLGSVTLQGQATMRREW